MLTTRNPQTLIDALRLPTLPESVNKVRDLLMDEDVGTTPVAAAIRKDPALAAGVLRIANSVQIGSSEPRVSIHSATAALGLRTVAAIVLRAGLISTYKHLNDVKGVNVREVWRHSIRVGMVSKQLARACRTRAADLMPQDDYTCGLLHDIGEIVLYDNFGEEYVILLNSRAQGTRQVAAEAAGLLGLDHTGIGALAATNWHLPSPLPELIKDHHRPLDKPSLAEAATVIASADEIVILVHANPTEDPKKLAAESQVIPIGCKPLGIVAAITCVQTARGQVTL